MTRSTVLTLVLGALFIALVTVSTMMISIPMIGTQGFINVGDTMIFVAAVMLGPKVGFIAGAIGSALADFLLGYAHWAPWTFVIKGVEGLIAGAIAFGAYENKAMVSLRVVVGLVAGAAWMVLGYYIAGGLIYGFAPALADVPGNLIQGGASIVLASVLLVALRRVNFRR